MHVELNAILDQIPLLISVSAMIYAFFANRRKDVDQRFDAMQGRVERIDKRVTALEQEVRNLPAKEDVHALQMTMSEMMGEMKAMVVKMNAMSEMMARTENIVTRHEDHLRGSN